ncbi:MAG: hypothetical protein LBI19_01675 [Oscillospiraceae bacterium]|nr:hypothetical protein [Oscillospiraceae bacterium]
MKCRRCGRELPIGQRKTCPFCGIYLETIITPRDPTQKLKKPRRRASLMTFISIGLVLIVVSVVIPVLRNVNEGNMRVSIEATYAELEGREAEFSEDDWEMKLASFSAAVENYKKAYPDNDENIERHKRLLYSLAGIDPDTGEFEGPTEQEIYNERLILRGRDEILDVTSITLTAPDSSGRSTLTVHVKNTSNRFISGVSMLLTIYDANGRPSNGSPRNNNEWYPNTDSLLPGEEKSFLFTEDWSDASAASAKISWINVMYSDRDPVYFPPEVCDVLWP